MGRGYWSLIDDVQAGTQRETCLENRLKCMHKTMQELSGKHRTTIVGIQRILSVMVQRKYIVMNVNSVC